VGRQEREGKWKGRKSRRKERRNRMRKEIEKEKKKRPGCERKGDRPTVISEVGACV